MLHLEEAEMIQSTVHRAGIRIMMHEHVHISVTVERRQIRRDRPHLNDECTIGLARRATDEIECDATLKAAIEEVQLREVMKTARCNTTYIE